MQTQEIISHVATVLRYSLPQQRDCAIRKKTIRGIELLESLKLSSVENEYFSWGDDLADLAAALPTMQSPPDSGDKKNTTG